MNLDSDAKKTPACVCGVCGIQLGPHMEKLTDDYLGMWALALGWTVLPERAANL